MKCLPITVGGVEDHVHLLVALSRTVCVADLVKKLKTSSHGWLESKGQPSFEWQAGYGAFSVSKELLPTVSVYIKNQEEHHKKFDFMTEYRRILQEHDLEWDERYVWD